MNWGRGLFRLWVIVAICWIAATAVSMWDGLSATEWDRRLVAISIILGPPIGVMLLSLAAVWVMEGFKADDVPGRWDELDRTVRPRWRRWWPW